MFNIFMYLLVGCVMLVALSLLLVFFGIIRLRGSFTF